MPGATDHAVQKAIALWLRHGQGYRALLSAPWYLNLGSLATEDWAQYYVVDPHAFPADSQVNNGLCESKRIHEHIV